MGSRGAGAGEGAHGALLVGGAEIGGSGARRGLGGRGGGEISA
jgi:hypothetical protein